MITIGKPLRAVDVNDTGIVKLKHKARLPFAGHIIADHRSGKTIMFDTQLNAVWETGKQLCESAFVKVIKRFHHSPSCRAERQGSGQ